MSTRKNRKRFGCGHRGYGTYCHRCEFAENLLAMANSNIPYKTNKKTSVEKIKIWTRDEMFAEVKRLKKVIRS